MCCSITIKQQDSKNLIEKHYKKSFNQCYKVQIYDDSKEQQKVNSLTSSQQYYLKNQTIQYVIYHTTQQTNLLYPIVQIYLSIKYKSELNESEIIGSFDIIILLLIVKGSSRDIDFSINLYQIVLQRIRISIIFKNRNQSKSGQGQQFLIKVLTKGKFLGHATD
ncbi:unnamed protein product [Paramecium pentaurelia]|uniref:Uncharacterized protein n=1 Tax=Paramecium pentaurelia TaxID=43138 RepID=A0A8S1YKW2_9CILI|nr:unnamed protein product [Paramecium pentaurelia]